MVSILSEGINDDHPKSCLSSQHRRRDNLTFEVQESALHMKTILVPTDFSAVSVNAAYYATEMARKVQADVILLHVLVLPVTISEVPVPYDNHEAALADATEEMDRLKDRLIQFSESSVRISYRIETGIFMDQLEDLAEEHAPFAIVMGATGAGAAETFFLGSHTLSAARNMPHPVVIVPAGAGFAGLQKAGLACDMKNVQETIPVEKIRNACMALEIPLEVLYISPQDKTTLPEVLDGTRYLKRELSGLQTEVHIVEEKESVAAEIKAAVQRLGIGLLLIVPRKHGFLDALFHKSVSKQVILQPGIPVMVLNQG